QTVGRRVTGSQSAGPKPERKGKSRKPTNQTPRYVEPENSDQEKLTSTSRAEFIQTTHSPPPQLPVRLFARNYYPNKPRLNIYSKATIIGSIVKLLKGTPELDKLLGIARCLNSAKLVHSLVSRQLVMLLKYELWFLFADNPLQFSLREFGDITGLKCDPIVGNVVIESSPLTVFEDESGVRKMWKNLFVTEDVDVRVPKVLQMLAEPQLHVWKRFPLALIALVDCLIVCGHNQLRVTPSYVRMVENPETFLEYSWGREAFLTTLSRLTPPAAASPSAKAKSLEVMRVWLKQQTTQHVMVSLWRCNYPEGCSTTNKLLHFEDIIEVETDTEVVVTFSLPDEGDDFKWEDEIEDPTVQKLATSFKSRIFGGDSSLPPLIGTSKVTGIGETIISEKIEEPGCSSQPQRHPSRPQRGIGVEPESTDSGEINEELKAWIRGELSAQLQTFREEIYGWLHPNERCSNHDNRRGRSLDRKCKACEKNRQLSSPENEVGGSHNSCDGFEVDNGGSQTEKHMDPSADGFYDHETTMNDNFRERDESTVGFNNANDALTVVANDAPTVVANDAPTVIANDAPTVVASDAPTVIASDAPTVIANDAPIVVANDAPTVVANDAPTVQTPSPEATILGADQLATAVKAVFHMFVGENNGFLTVEESPMTTWLNLLAHEVENASGVDHEDSELVDNSLALVLAKPKTYVLSSQQDFVDSAEIGTSAPDETNPENNETSSPTNSEDYKTPPEDGPTAKSRTPEGGNFLLSLSRPTNWVSAEHIHVLLNMMWRRHESFYLNQWCALMDHYPIACILPKVAKFEEATYKRNFDWAGPAKCFVTGKSC
ncbi:hypothetical protein HID58_014876, partial [Brassica napus]